MLFSMQPESTQGNMELATATDDKQFKAQLLTTSKNNSGSINRKLSNELMVQGQNHVLAQHLTCYDYSAFGTRFALLMDSLRSIGNRGSLQGANKEVPGYPCNMQRPDQQIIQTATTPNISTTELFFDQQNALGLTSQNGSSVARYHNPIKGSYISAPLTRSLADSNLNSCSSPTYSHNKSNLSSPSVSTASSSSSTARD